MTQLNTNIQLLMEAQVQFRILHWQTKSYARHMAFDRIYGSLDGHVDKFAETAMGKYGRFKLSTDNKSLKLQNTSELNVVTYVKGLITKLIDFNKDLGEKDSDLLNIRDEILGDLNQLLYLLTLE